MGLGAEGVRTIEVIAWRMAQKPRGVIYGLLHPAIFPPPAGTAPSWQNGLRTSPKIAPGALALAIDRWATSLLKSLAYLLLFCVVFS